MTFFTQRYIDKTFPDQCDTKEFKHAFSSRSIPCPDGVARIITLTNWSWMALYWLCTSKGEVLDDMIALLWNTAVTETDDPEYQFRAGLEYYIHRGAMHYIAEDDNLANDDWFNPDWLKDAGGQS